MYNCSITSANQMDGHRRRDRMAKYIPMDTQHGLIRSMFCWIVLSMLWWLAPASASALEIQLDPPGDREFVRDLASMLDSDAKEHIRKVCDSLLTDKATPIIVVTIESMAKYGGEDLRIETFATLLFN